MKPSLSRRLLPLCALLTICVLSCKKNESSASTTSQQTTETLLMNATNVAADATNLQSMDMEDVMGSDSAADCRTITYDTLKTVYPHVKTVDYGTGCMGPDGVMRKGKRIITVYADALTASPGTLISVTTFEDFYVDDINIKGMVQSYIDSTSTADVPVIKNVAEKILSTSDGDSKTISSVNYWKKIEGVNTLNRHDDVFEITGSASGNETLDGATEMQWSSQINSEHHVIKPVSCDFRTKGAIDIQLHIITGGSSNFTEYLDYGDGTCDNKATLSINGGTAKEITLPLYFWPLSL
ncbi:hypothetical protein FRZ67_02440 [Panacibacter ginsenosidivorans]|uniref:Lipoprotein n=1 Tax=Panacibacter ginsenosidivorans TaxID=1813871 RepID=A0A5B8V4U7_9BACT|nr:hypothetical protein [Panacibacter ginsenosidivorans]QEC66219.1 hypothetical protein FRZ67_02440 [Panacibacter ginsenosidivorans]